MEIRNWLARPHSYPRSSPKGILSKPLPFQGLFGLPWPDRYGGDGSHRQSRLRTRRIVSVQPDPRSHANHGSVQSFAQRVLGVSTATPLREVRNPDPNENLVRCQGRLEVALKKAVE